MTESNQSPIVKFLLSPENRNSVLEILRHGPDVRKELGLRFFEKLQQTFQAAKPQTFSGELFWRNDFATDPEKIKEEWGFGVDALFLGSEAAKIRGIKYRIEFGPTWFGGGLAWRSAKGESDPATLRAMKPVKALLRQLQARRPDKGSDDGWPRYWLWWENWETKVYEQGDPWSYFANDFDAKDTPRIFWEIVTETHQLVAEANKTLVQA